jgi:hypothetical protein
MQQGIPEYDSGTTYFTGSLCTSGGVLYRSLQDNNTGNALTNSNFWLQASGLYAGEGSNGTTILDPSVNPFYVVPATADGSNIHVKTSKGPSFIFLPNPALLEKITIHDIDGVANANPITLGILPTFAWGDNTNFETGAANPPSNQTPFGAYSSPVLVQTNPLAAIAIQSAASYFLDKAGLIWAVGTAANGQLASGDVTPTRSVPTMVAYVSGATMIAAGGNGGYTRLDQVLRQDQAEFRNSDETVPQCLKRLRTEDPQLAVCLELAWLMQSVWNQTKQEYEKGRVLEVKTKTENGKPEEEESSPEGKAEKAATDADNPKDEGSTPTDVEREKRRKALIQEMTAAGVPAREAETLAGHLVEKGLSYAILTKSGLGSSFFNVRGVVDAKIIELNSDHAAYPLLMSSIEDVEDAKIEELRERLKDTKTTILLMLEAWAKVESQVQKNPQELKRYRTMREDWGRALDEFVVELESQKNQK